MVMDIVDDVLQWLLPTVGRYAKGFKNGRIMKTENYDFNGHPLNVCALQVSILSLILNTLVT